MKKLESTLKNMMLSLTCIAIVAGAALAGVNLLTAERIKAQKEAQKLQAISDVLPAHARIADAEESNGLLVYRAYDANDEFVGAAVQTVSEGFGGKIKLMVGFTADNKIVDYAVLEQQETPGLGTHIVEWFKDGGKPGQNILGRKANGQFTVSKDGGDVDAITAATISSRAFLLAVNNAYAALHGHDALSGASKQLHADEAEEADSALIGDSIPETQSVEEEQQVTNEFVSQDK